MLDHLLEVQWAMDEEVTMNAKAIEKACQNRFPEYEGKRRLWYWKKQYTGERWDLLPERMAAKNRQIPNSWKQWLSENGHTNKAGQKMKGPQPAGYKLPPELEQVLEKQMKSLAEGDNEAMPRAEPLDLKDVASTLQRFCSDCNDKVDEMKVAAGDRYSLASVLHILYIYINIYIYTLYSTVITVCSLRL